MNNETSFKQHNKERFIIVAGVRKCPFCVVGLWFVGSVCVKLAAACSSAMGFQVESVAVM